MDINNLSNEEVLKLTESDIDKYIKYECAEDGIKFEPAPIKPELTDKIKPTVECFIMPSMIVQDKQLAQKALDILTEGQTFHEEYDYGGAGYDYKYLEPFNFQISSKMLYDKNIIDGLSEKLKRFKIQKEEYSVLHAAYEENKKKYDVISKNIYAYIDNIKEKFEKRNKYQKTYNEYLSLTGGDEHIAKTFFIKAYPEAEEILFSVESNILKEPI